MPEAKTKKKSVTKTKSASSPRKADIDKILIENFVSLQKVMTNLSLKFEGLSSQISKLLELFEISAKTLAKKDFSSEKGVAENKEVLEKLDNLMDQNKTIARGLTLLHEPNAQMEPQRPRPPRPMAPEFPGQKPPVEMNKYQKSISSRDNVAKP